MQEEAQGRFDEIAEFFDAVTETPLHRMMRAAVVQALRPLQGRRVLDLGTGPGGLTLDLLSGGATVLGIDVSGEMLRRARRRLPEEGVRLVRGEASSLPLADGEVDDVAGMLVLHLLDDPVPALRECRRVARPGARLAFLTQSDDFGPDAVDRVRGPLDLLEREFLGGCAESAASHPRRDRTDWAEAYAAAGLPPPTITLAVPGVAWLLFTQMEAQWISGRRNR